MLWQDGHGPPKQPSWRCEELRPVRIQDVDAEAMVSFSHCDQLNLD